MYNKEEIYLFLATKDAPNQIIPGQDQTKHLESILQATAKMQADKDNLEKRVSRVIIFGSITMVLAMLIGMGMMVLGINAKNLTDRVVANVIGYTSLALFLASCVCFSSGNSPLLSLQEKRTYRSIKKANEQKFSAFKNRYAIFSPKEVIENKKMMIENKSQEDLPEILENFNENKVFI